MSKKTNWTLAGKKAWRTRRANLRKKGISNGITLKVGTDAHKLVIRLLKAGVDREVLARASGKSLHVIGAIKAHVTMGTY
jgi:hypothetical protein